jgi:serine/threonine protein kinase
VLGRQVDRRSDIFSLGSVLYELISGEPTFGERNEMDLLLQVRDVKYTPLDEIIQGVPPEIVRICHKCLNRPLLKRYQNADELSVELKAFVTKEMPEFSRSHLGTLLRNLFADEIEEELRMLEDFMVSEAPAPDYGKSLIRTLDPSGLGFEPEVSEASHQAREPRDPPSFALGEGDTAVNIAVVPDVPEPETRRRR